MRRALDASRKHFNKHWNISHVLCFCAQHLVATARSRLWRSAEAVAQYAETRGVRVHFMFAKS